LINLLFFLKREVDEGRVESFLKKNTIQLIKESIGVKGTGCQLNALGGGQFFAKNDLTEEKAFQFRILGII